MRRRIRDAGVRQDLARARLDGASRITALLIAGVAVAFIGGGSGCAPTVSVVRSGAPRGTPNHPARVRVYLDESAAPERYQELGLIIANTHVFLPVNVHLDTQIALSVQRLPEGNQRRTEVFQSLIRRAARLGADAVIVKSFEKAGVHLTVAGVAIRTCASFDTAGEARPRTPASSPGPGCRAPAPPAPAPAPETPAAPAPPAPAPAPETPAAPAPPPAPETPGRSEAAPANTLRNQPHHLSAQVTGLVPR
jgi:hypothetical protein